MRLTKIGKIYHAQFKTAAGKTKSVSTKATSKEEAELVAKASGIKDLELAARAGRLTAEAIGQITTGKKLTLAKAVAEFTEWQKTVGRADRTVQSYRDTLERWLRDTGIEALPPTVVTETHVSAWINAKNEKTGAAARTLMLVAIRALFDFTAAKGWTIGNPARLVEVRLDQLSHRQKEKKTVKPFSAAEVQDLIDEAEEDNPFWPFAIRLSYENGFRLGDIAQLEWDCFAMEGHIIIWTGKSDKRLALPISKEIQNLITEIPAASAKYLFPEQRILSLDPKRRALLSVQFSRLAERAGVEGKSFHGLRHAFCSRLRKEGKTLEEIGKLVGHSDAKTTKGYVHE